jgi:hypothetical protein
MSGLVRDMLKLSKLELPASFDKKRVILNFVVLYLSSMSSRLFGQEKSYTIESDDNVQIDSKIWQSFNHVISMYVKYLSVRYLMCTYIIRGVATGWHSKSYVDFLKENFKPEHIAKIRKETVEVVERVTRAIASKFEGVDYDTVRRWLLTYQYGLSDFHDDEKKLQDTLENTLVIELGAGIGANVAVHAALSKKGVYIFDIPPMLQVQKLVIEQLSDAVEMSDIKYFHDPQELMEAAKKQPYIIVSYWAFTEFPEDLRKTLDPLLQGAEFSFFACNSEFEGINNLEYFEETAKRLTDKTVTSKPIDWNPYKKHAYVMMK